MSGSQPYDIQFRPSYVRIKGLYASQLPDNLSGPNDMGSSNVTIVVGQDRKFTGPAKELCEASEFFDLALRHGWRESETNTVTLAEEKPENFDVFLQFILRATMTIHFGAADWSDVFVDLILFGQFLQATTFTNLMADAFVYVAGEELRRYEAELDNPNPTSGKCVVHAWYCTKWNPTKCLVQWRHDREWITRSAISKAWAALPSPLESLLPDLMAHCPRMDLAEPILDDPTMPKEFARRRLRPFTKRAFNSSTLLALCKYHLKTTTLWCSCGQRKFRGIQAATTHTVNDRKRLRIDDVDEIEKSLISIIARNRKRQKPFRPVFPASRA